MSVFVWMHFKSHLYLPERPKHIKPNGPPCWKIFIVLSLQLTSAGFMQKLAAFAAQYVKVGIVCTKN